MSNVFLSELHRNSGKLFSLGVITIVAILGISSMETLLKLYRDPQIQPSGYHVSLMQSAFCSDSFMAFIPIVASLPFSGIYVDEIKSKYARFVVLRIGYSSYLLGRIIVGFLLGGAVVLSGVLVSYFIFALALLPIEQVNTSEISQFSGFVGKCSLLFINSGLWSVFGMTMSTIMESKYIANASPFVMYYLFVILCERYFPDAYLLYPCEWLNPSDKWPLGIWGVAIYLIELTAILGLMFYRRGRRRLEQL